MRILLTRRVASVIGRRFASSTVVSYDTSREVFCERLVGSENGIVLFHMNRPKTMNALGRNFVSQYYDAIESVKHDKNVRVVILKSDVRDAFCAGADLKERAGMSQEELSIFSPRLRRLMREIELLPMVVIAAMDGVALGGGLEMALACDLRVTADTAKMGLVETKLAIIPGAGGTQRLPRLIGPALAKEMIYTGRIINGVDAYKLGVVNHVVGQSSSEDGAFQLCLELAKEIAPQGPIALRMAKMAIDRGLNVDIESGMGTEQLCYAQTMPTKDRLEGLAAFKEKRAPAYKGE